MRPRHLLLATVWFAAAWLAGCVERTLEIRTVPPGARVWVDGRLRGVTGKEPLVVSFDHYGTRELRAEKEGFVPAVKRESVAPPFYQVFPLDFFFECLCPFTLRDRNAVTLRLEKIPPRGSAGLAAQEKKLVTAAETMRKELSRDEEAAGSD